MTSIKPPPYIAGADGCPGGWIVVRHPLNRPSAASWHLFETFEALLAATADHQAIAIDMPIGLPSVANSGGRLADRAARAVLGARQSSVFAVPARAAIACVDYRNACAVALEHSDPPRKVAKQTFNLFPKIRQVDALMTPALQNRVFECHPEVAFWAMNGKIELSEPKKRKSSPYPRGLKLRRELLIAQGFTPQFLVGPDCPGRIAATDDFLDACATAWTANRFANKIAERFPTKPLLDARSLRMEIVY
jgi:predicted RNase H-like nuclease